MVGVQFAALGMPRELRQYIWDLAAELAAPAYLKGRVAKGRQPPAVAVVEG